LCEATGGLLSKEYYPVHTMLKAVVDYQNERENESRAQTKADTVRKMKHELYEEFLKVANCQKAGEPNMRIQDVFYILDQKEKELLEEK
jgi:hypothetical protein